jgi:cytochrome P450
MLDTATLPALKSIDSLPAPASLPLIGNLHQIDLEHFHEQLEQWCDELGPIFKIRMGKRDIICLADTDAINDLFRLRPSVYRRVRAIESVTAEMNIKGVFSAEGDEWKLQRKVVAQALNSAHINRFFPKLFETTGRLQRRWEGLAASATPVELCRDVMRYTVDVTTQLAFGIDVDTIGTDGPVVQQHLDKVFPMLHRRINAPFPYWRYFRLPSDRALARSLAVIEETVNGFIVACRERMSQQPELFEAPGNFLEAIIAAQASESGSDFTDQQIYANVLTLLLAGEDTTANTIAWACKYFIDYPEHFARARAEVDAVLGEAPIPTEPQQLKQFPFIEAFVNETMRLKPVGPIAPMETNEPVELLGYHIPAGTSIFGLTRYIAVAPINFGAARNFAPERWLEGADNGSEAHNTSAFLPFGTGPRFCPGRNLALTEIKMVIAMLCRNFDLSLANPQIPVEEKLAFAMMPKNLHVRFHPRA